MVGICRMVWASRDTESRSPEIPVLCESPKALSLIPHVVRNRGNPVSRLIWYCSYLTTPFKIAIVEGT